MPNYTGTLNIFNSWSQYLATSPNLSSDTFKVGLTTSLWTPNQATHTVLADVTNEVSGSGYARATVSVTFSISGSTATFSSTSAIFSASGGTITARYWFLFDDTPTSPADPLVAYGLIDNTPADVATASGSQLTISPPGSGWFTITRV